MAKKVKGPGTTDDPGGTRIVEKRFALKHGEEISDIRLSVATAPVGGIGPRPKREVVFTVVLAAFAGTESTPRRKMQAMDERAPGANGENIGPEKRKKTGKKGRARTLSLADFPAGVPIGGPNHETGGSGKRKKTGRKDRKGPLGDLSAGTPTGGKGQKRTIKP